MKDLLELYSKPSRTILGLMSGTSHDGVDAAIVRIGDTVRLLHHSHLPFNSPLRERIARAFSGTVEEICQLNFELGEVFAEAALACIRECGLSTHDIDLIASHGQTIYHIPPDKDRIGSTLQIGESSVIAERTGIPVISDFRAADIAAGGHGAPLVPMADYIMFRKEGRTTAVQNIGGIANVTVVTDRVDRVIAFDTGPGMSLIDEAVTLLTGGSIHYDADGRLAKKGKVIEGLLSRLLSHPYLQEPPPKSTGRETFGREMVMGIIKEYRDSTMEDILSTLTHFTALSIHRAYQEFIFPKFSIDEIILCGGGSKNGFLTGLIKGLLRPVEIRHIEDYGIPAQAKEAMSFAILANETISGRQGNIPSATGARRGVILGKIVYQRSSQLL